jgi:hypothetical protein
LDATENKEAGMKSVTVDYANSVDKEIRNILQINPGYKIVIVVKLCSERAIRTSKGDTTESCAVFRYCQVISVHGERSISTLQLMTDKYHKVIP